MGCSNSKEKIEDQINLIILKKYTIQLEREKSLKLLLEMEDRNNNAENLEEYLASKNVKQFQNLEMKYNEKNNEIPKEKEINKDNKNKSLIPNSIKKDELNDNNQNRYINILPNDNNKHFC